MKPVGRPSVTRVLVVAGKDPQEPIAGGLKQAGYGVLRADDNPAAARLLERAHPDAVVIHEPAVGRRGAESLAALAAQHGVPVVTVSHRVTGDPGAPGDSIVQKVQAALAGSRADRPQTDEPDTERLTVGTLVIDLDQHTACVAGASLDLTAKEFELLTHFARRPGRIWSRQQLIDLIWGYDYVDPHVVTVHIGNLRKKLERAGAAAAAPPGAAGPLSAVPSLEVVRGVGYRLVCPDEHPPASAVVASRAQAGGGPPAPVRSSGSGRLPFVGRERELEILRGLLDATMNGEVRAAAIVGDPGIGKTRLAEEAATYARDAGARVYWGRCRDASVKPVYEPWVEILEQWRRESPTSDFDPVFATEPPEEAQAPMDTAGARLRLFGRLAHAVRCQAEAGPVCVFFDDLHWADPSTLLALQYVLGHLRDAPVMFVCTYRPGEAAQCALLSDVLNDLVRGDLGAMITLGPLSQGEVGLFMELSGLDGTSVDVYAETKGDPFFMTQLVRLRLLEGGSPESAADRLALSREEGVRRVVLSRLARLSAPCREALEMASIIGREFAHPLLARAMDLDPGVLLEHLGEAFVLHILLTREDAPEEYCFVHSIFRDVLQDELSPRRRAILHGRVGSVLEELHADRLDAYAADLAHHFSEAAPAGFVPQAVDHCLRAARVAASQYAWAEARARLRRAADLIDLLPADAPQKSPAFVGRVWEDLAYQHWAAMDLDQAMETYEEAARRIPPSDRSWRASLMDKAAYMDILCHRYQPARARLAEAESLLGPPSGFLEESQWDTWLSINRHRGLIHLYEGRFDELNELVEHVERTLGPHGGPRDRGHFRHVQILAEWTRGRWISTDKILDLAEECAKNLRASGSPEDVLWAENTLADALLWSPDRWEDAGDQIMLLLDLSKRYCSVFGELGALWDLLIWHRRRGEVEAVRRHALAMLALTEGPKGILTAYAGEAKAHLSWAAWREGDREQARMLGTEALKEIREDVASAYEWQARWSLLGLALHDQDWAEAAVQAAAMLDPMQQKMPYDLEELMHRLVDQRARDGAPRPETAETLIATARAYGYL